MKNRAQLDINWARMDWALIAYIAAGALPLLVAFVIKVTALPVPFEDEWEWAQLIYLMHLGNLHFVNLWQQHNEHRMLFPNLIMLGLAMLGGWNQLRETLFSLLLVVVTQIGLLLLLRRIIAEPRLSFTFLAVSLLLYSLAQMENWDWGFQMAWFLCNLCAVWMLVFLGSAGQSSFALIAAVVLAVVASFSSSQGLMLWPAGLATLIFTQKRNRVHVTIWILCAASAFLIYFHGFVRPGAHPSPVLAFEHPLTSMRYFGAYFGSVFAGWTGFAGACALGWIALAALTFLLYLVVLKYRSDREQAARANGFVGLAVYALAVAGITTVGRVGFGQEQAEASRYTSIAIYCWISVFALAVAYADELRARLPRSVVSLGPAAVLFLSILYLGADRAGYALGAGRLASVRTAYPALIVGHGAELTALYPVEPPVEEFIKELQTVKDGPYYE